MILVFWRLMVRPKSSQAFEKEEVLEIVVTMSNQSCIVGKQKVSEENLADFSFRSESGKIEKFAISAGTEKNASICCSKGMFQEH